MRIFAWVVVLACSLGCSSTITSRTPVTTETNWTKFVVPGEVPEPLNAITRCQNGRPVVHFGSHVPDSMKAELWAHERVHVEHLTKNAPCDEAFEKLMRNPYALLRNEAEAYCAQLDWVMVNKRPGLDPLATLINLASGVADFYAQLENPRWHVPRAVITAMFVRACPEVIKT